MKKILVLVMIAVFSMFMVSPASAAISQAKLNQMRENAQAYLDQFEMTSIKYLFDSFDECKGGDYKIRGKFEGFTTLHSGGKEFQSAAFEDENEILVFVLAPAGYRFNKGTYYTFVGKNLSIKVDYPDAHQILFEYMSFDFLPIMSEYGF